MTPAHSRPGPELPRRSDARRNRERLVDAARAVFAESGPEASLNEIAQRAGVGPGTLYRNFPNRRTLLAAVLRDRIDTLCGHAEQLLTADSADRALAEWLHAFLEHARINQGLGGSLLLDEPETLALDCHRRIEDAAAALLVRAQRSGTARADLAPGDLIQLVVGVALATVRVEDAAQPGRLLGLALDAVHAGPRPADRPTGRHRADRSGQPCASEPQASCDDQRSSHGDPPDTP